jgi:hypothetical protein
VDIYRHLLYFASKEDLSCHVNHHQTSHLSSPMISLSNNHSSGTVVSLVGVHNLDNLSWSGATFKFLPSPLNQAAPVQSPYSCPLAWIGIHNVSPSDTRRGGFWSEATTFFSTTPQNQATYYGSESGSEEDKQCLLLNTPLKHAGVW